MDSGGRANAAGWAIGTTLLTAVGLAAVVSGRIPLGVPGEWEWLRVTIPAEPIALGLGLVAVAVYSCVAAVGLRTLARTDRPHRAVEGAWLGLLFVAAVLVQGMIQEAAPTGHGLAKWALALINPGSSGYYTVARERMHDTPRFLADYSEWIRSQGSLHIGTHPPGLFLWARGSLDVMEARPDLARGVIAWAPESVDRAFRAVVGEGGLAAADRASLIVTGAATLIVCAGTVVPLYLLARRRMNAAGAWAVASAWPLVPAALMFQPASDTAFPLLAVGAWLAISWSERAWGWAIVAGVIMAIGMQFSLVFLAVGAIAAVVIATAGEASLARRATRFFATGAGFLAMTVAAGVMMRANPFAIWWANQANHAQFYVDFPRSRLAWTLETPIEVAVAIGLAYAARAAAGLRLAPRETWAAAAVLLLLLITGRSLSEVARLWIPFFPLLLLAVGREFADGRSRSASLAWMLALAGIQTIVLQTAIQVVYPVPV